MPAALVYPLALFPFGLCVGSFLNVVIFRLPHGISITFPGSHCPGCGRELGALENLPVLSWLLQRGRCRGCGARISWRYPAVELLTGLLWAGVAWAFHDLEGTAFVRITAMIATLFFVSLLVAVSFIDIDLRIIPDELNALGLGLALLAGALAPEALHPDALDRFPAVGAWLNGLIAGGIGMLVGAGLMYAISLVGTLALRRRLREMRRTEDPELDSAMGLGDVKLMGFLGAFLGWQGVLLAFVLSTFYGSFGGILQKLWTGQGGGADALEALANRWRTGRSLLPYGPFLCLGALTVLFFRAELLALVRDRFAILLG